MSEHAERKVVINSCHGGFGLSWAAMQRMGERRGLVASYFSLNPDIHAKCYGDKPVEPDELSTHRVIGPHHVDAYPQGDDHKEFLRDSDFKRDDPDLVAVVEELGEAANGWAARLTVVSIPADVEWVVEEYDGREWIAEAHRTWG